MSKPQSVPGTEKQLHIAAGQQWSDLFGKCNWYDFTLIKLAFEYAPYMGNWEIDVALLGFYVRITWIFDMAPRESLSGVKDQILASIRAAHPDTEILDPNGVLDTLDKK